VIEFITNEASQTTVLESGFALPSRAALINHPHFQSHPESATIFRGATGATPFMWGLYGSDVNEKMGQALERIYLKGQDPEASFRQAAQELREILGK
jgi:multiple sugar transport system substrate-binding protein